MAPHRRRHPVNRAWLVILWPLFRYSITRDAYVLRGVGRRRGPVLQLATKSMNRAGDNIAV